MQSRGIGNRQSINPLRIDKIIPPQLPAVHLGEHDHHLIQVDSQSVRGMIRRDTYKCKVGDRALRGLTEKVQEKSVWEVNILERGVHEKGGREPMGPSACVCARACTRACLWADAHEPVHTYYVFAYMHPCMATVPGIHRLACSSPHVDRTSCEADGARSREI